MNGPAPECPACRERMEEGFAYSMDSQGRYMQMTWTEGPVEKGGLHGLRVKGKRQYAAATWRCPRCGWLLWFAPNPEA
jgi:hypothetical protein